MIIVIFDRSSFATSVILQYIRWLCSSGMCECTEKYGTVSILLQQNVSFCHLTHVRDGWWFFGKLSLLVVICICWLVQNRTLSDAWISLKTFDGFWSNLGKGHLVTSRNSWLDFEGILTKILITVPPPCDCLFPSAEPKLLEITKLLLLLFYVAFQIMSVYENFVDHGGTLY